MPFNGSGTFVRTQNWTNDANNNLPISATKFDNEDNDFASGLSLCLTRDGQGVPSTPLTWTQALTINLAADGSPFKAGRTGGANNPQLQLALADATGGQLNLTTAQTLGLAIQGTNVISMTATGVTIAQPLTAALQIASGTVGAPGLAFSAETNSGLYRVGAGDLGLAVLGAETLDIQAHQLAVLGAAAASATLSIAGNGVSIANGFQIVYGSAGGVTINYGGAAFATISSAGVWTINAPSAGIGLTVGGANGAFAAQINGNSTSGGSRGLNVNSGTTSADYCALFQSQSTTLYMAIYGDGESVIAQPSAAAQQGSPNWQIGYLDMPLNTQTAAYTLVFTDRGKFVRQATTGGVTIPANGSVAFPVGTTIMVYNNTGSAQTISITTDSLTWLPSGSTGTRTLANLSIATLYKVGATGWLIWGFGLS